MTTTAKITIITNAVIRLAEMVRDNAPAILEAVGEIRTAVESEKGIRS